MSGHDVVFLVGIAWTTGLMAVCVALLWRGPTITRRLLALDVLVLVLVADLALVAGWSQRTFPLDAALALALLSFIATIAGARYAADAEPFG